MRRQVFGIAVLLIFVGAVSGRAESSLAFASNIPFDFIVGNMVLPAGHYSLVQPVDTTNRLLLRDAKGHTWFIPVKTTESALRVKEDRLEFHQFNGVYFLASMWTAGSSTGRVLYTSRREREMLAQGEQGITKRVLAKAR